MKQIIQQFDKKHNTWKVYSDFLEISAISISNTCDLANWEEREKKYLEVIKPYSKEDLLRFSKLLAKLVEELERNPRDILGELYMSLELGNKWTGQFFTPYHLAKLLAEVSFDNAEITQNGYHHAYDSAVGGGVTVIALANVMREKKYNPQRQLLVTAGDLDIKAVYMTFVQLSLMGIPAEIRHQNALTLEYWGSWYTPAYILGGWSWKRGRVI